jgi:hypothetical protein
MRCPWALALFLFVLSLTSAPNRANAQACLEIVTVESQLNFRVGEMFEELFADKNPCFVVSYLPSARASKSMIERRFDGEQLRVDAFMPFNNADVVKVPVPILRGKGILVTHDPDIKSISDLGTLVLGLQRGIEWSTSVSKGHLNSILLPNYRIMVDMFTRKRLDAFLIDHINILDHQEKLAGAHKTTIVERNAYLWLAGNHRKLVPAISQTLEDFYASGQSFDRVGSGW